MLSIKKLITSTDRKAVREFFKPKYTREPHNKRVNFLGHHIFRKFLERVVEHALDGDRILFPNNRQIYIGVDKSFDALKKYDMFEKFANLHTAGKQYGLIIDGVKEDYHVKLTIDYRNELARRLKDGKEYYEK